MAKRGRPKKIQPVTDTTEVGQMPSIVPEEGTGALSGFMKIKAGAFLAGEKKDLAVISNDYYIGKYPVTIREYAAFVKAGDQGYNNPEYWTEEAYADTNLRNIETTGSIKWDQLADDAYGLQPITYVNWYEARAYAGWVQEKISKELGKPVHCDLPYEAQWEYAARGNDGRKYPWGEDEPTREHAVFAAPGPERVDTRPKGASPWGVMDMSGNVWECCLDVWHSEYPSRAVDPFVPPTTIQMQRVIDKKFGIEF